MKIIIIGGGAAGFFSALAAKEKAPEAEVLILESTAKLLSKVRISGGGRCNVTHHCFEPSQLVKNYPRGERELLGPFHKFQPQDTIRWFKERGVDLKSESDGRMFPITNSSETIIHCFLKEAERLGIKIQMRCTVKKVEKKESGFFLDVGREEPLIADALILACGSSPIGAEIAHSLGHTIQKAVPSLFTFNIPDFPLVHLSGVVANPVQLKLADSGFVQEGSLLITHWGFSGPAALKLSAWGARYLAEKKYETSLFIDWLPEYSEEKLRQLIEQNRKTHPADTLGSLRFPPLSKSLYKSLLARASLSSQTLFNSIGCVALAKFCEVLKRDIYHVKGKTTNKEEFVTCGGVTLSEIDFRTMESKCCKGLYFCGEVLDIDGVTGGFNFQNAWTTGWLAGRASVYAN